MAITLGTAEMGEMLPQVTREMGEMEEIRPQAPATGARAVAAVWAMTEGAADLAATQIPRDPATAGVVETAALVTTMTEDAGATEVMAEGTEAWEVGVVTVPRVVPGAMEETAAKAAVGEEAVTVERAVLVRHGRGGCARKARTD